MACFSFVGLPSNADTVPRSNPDSWKLFHMFATAAMFLLAFLTTLFDNDSLGLSSNAWSAQLSTSSKEECGHLSYHCTGCCYYYCGGIGWCAVGVQGSQDSRTNQRMAEAQRTNQWQR